MKLHILSDLHTEFADFVPPETDAEAVILAGDIGVGVEGVRWAARHYPVRPVIYVPGNHEFYGHDIDLTAELEAAARRRSLVCPRTRFGVQALAIERFDRLSDGTKVHIEDFAQIFGVYPRDKYKKASYMNIARVIGAECSNGDIAEFIRRLTFNTLIGNADMHMKNWSTSYPDRHNAVLSPAYDFVATIAYLKDYNAALTFSRTRRFDGFSEDELAHLAARAKLPETLVLDAARETVHRFHEHWDTEKKNLPLHKDVVSAVEQHVKTIPIG